jgi:hypothetical protein
MSFRERLIDFAVKLGAPPQWAAQLFDDALPDDWTLVVRLHAFVESACVECLQRKLGADASGFVDAMTMHGRTGRVPLLRSLNIIRDDDFAFLSAFGSLRNRLVHSIRNVTIDLRAEFADANGRLHPIGQSLFAAARPRLPRELRDGTELIDTQEIWARQPALGLWWVTLQILGELAADSERSSQSMWQLAAINSGAVAE